MSAVHVTLAAMAYLMFKHTVADFYLQSETQWRQKGTYGAPGGIIHALTHILLTGPLFFLFPGGGPTLAFAIMLGEFVVHYHIDWAKEQLIRYEGWTARDPGFWWTLGTDQLLHGLTYVVILWIWLAPA